jgi:hypothetical protein
MVGFLRSVEKNALNALDERDYALNMGFISDISGNF